MSTTSLSIRQYNWCLEQSEFYNKRVVWLASAWNLWHFFTFSQIFLLRFIFEWSSNLLRRPTTVQWLLPTFVFNSKPSRLLFTYICHYCQNKKCGINFCITKINTKKLLSAKPTQFALADTDEIFILYSQWRHQPIGSRLPEQMLATKTSREGRSFF